MSELPSGGRPPSVFVVVGDFMRYSGGYWRDQGQKIPLLLSVALALSLVGRLLVDFGVNTWNRYFFDALGARDLGKLEFAVMIFPALLLGMAGIGAAIVYLRETIQVGWRKWLTDKLLRVWLMGPPPSSEAVEHPEYRISDDVRLATEPMLDFVIGLFSALLAGTLFIGVLWKVGGSLPVSFGGLSVTIPAYYVLAAILYGLLVNGVMPMVGWRLTAEMQARNEAEAQFRFALIDSRKFRGERDGAVTSPAAQVAALSQVYLRVFITWTRVIIEHVKLTIVSVCNSAMAPVVPLFLGVPGFVSGRLTLGEVVQLSLAFVQVQSAMTWFADNYLRLAEWRASALRILRLVEASADRPVPEGAQAPLIPASIES